MGDAARQRRVWSEGRLRRERAVALACLSSYRLQPRMARWLLRRTSLDWLRRWGIRNALQVGVNRQFLRFSHLPAAFHGYRLLHLSDLHFGTLPGIEPVINRLVAGQSVALAVITGDFAPFSPVPGHPLLRQLLKNLAHLVDSIQATEGILAVLGNHDSATLVPHLEDLGIRVLVNETVTLRRQDDVIHVTGLDDVHHFHTPAADQALREAPSGFKMALVHSPGIVALAVRSGFSLYLCGHTHGGQVCLPGGWPLVTRLPLRLRKYATGLWRMGAMTGYTSRGTGVAYPSIRFNCPGEVGVLTLERSEIR